LGIAPRAHQRKNGAAVGRRHRKPAAPGFVVFVHHHTEAEPIDEEAQAPLLVAYKDVDAQQTKVWTFAVLRRFWRGWGGGAHRCDYKWMRLRPGRLNLFTL